MFFIIRSKNLIDIILSKTQRKTPTIIHHQFSIYRIRKFYIKKVKFVQQKFQNYISSILKFFPMIDQTHQFYNIIFHIMFHKDYYKIALSRLNNSKIVVGKICNNYIKLLKYGNSLFTCKNLKKNAIGRICTIIKKLDQTFIYLEKVREQLKKIPVLDPYRKSIIIIGCTNTGKSSLMNKITKANVEVSFFNHTTKFLQIGHLTKDYFRWQIIDTPAIRNLNFSKCNSNEIQIINAFIHLDHDIIFISDPLDTKDINEVFLFQQIQQFKYILNLCKTKKKFFLLGKTDLGWEKRKNRKKKAYIFSIFKIYHAKIKVLKISLHDEVGILAIYHKACNLDIEKSEKKVKNVNSVKYFHQKLSLIDNNLKKIKHNDELYIDNQINNKRRYWLTEVKNKSTFTKYEDFASHFPIRTEKIENEEKVREYNQEENYSNRNLLHTNIKNKPSKELKIVSNNNNILVLD